MIKDIGIFNIFCIIKIIMITNKLIYEDLMLDVHNDYEIL